MVVGARFSRARLTPLTTATTTTPLCLLDENGNPVDQFETLLKGLLLLPQFLQLTGQ